MLDVRIVVTSGRGQCPEDSVGVVFLDNGDWNSSVHMPCSGFVYLYAELQGKGHK